MSSRVLTRRNQSALVRVLKAKVKRSMRRPLQGAGLIIIAAAAAPVVLKAVRPLAKKFAEGLRDVADRSRKPPPSRQLRKWLETPMLLPKRQPRHPLP